VALLLLGFALGRRKPPEAVPTAGAIATDLVAREAAATAGTVTASTALVPREMSPVAPLPKATPLAAASPASAPCACPLILHEVRPGDRLWDLSAHYYRDPFKWKRLFRENRDLVADPDVIFPGQRIRVPDPKPPARAGRKDAAR
jgi:nucleoid-associated protein YgaU